MVCRFLHTPMPRACGKPGHFSWIRAERHSPSQVSPRDNRSSFHISTPGPSTACGRRGGLCTVDKWHVSVDNRHHLGRGEAGERFSRGIMGAWCARQAGQLDVRRRRFSVLSSTQFLVLHRRRILSTDGTQSAVGVLPQSMRVACTSSRPLLIPLHISPGPTTTSINTCKRDGRERLILPNRAANLNHRDAA